MASSLNLAKLFQSLVVAPPKGAVPARRNTSAPVEGCGVRGKHTLDHLHSITYPVSLVEADTRVASPASVSAVRQRCNSPYKVIVVAPPLTST